MNRRLCLVAFACLAFQPCVGFVAVAPKRTASSLQTKNDSNEDSFQDSALEMKQSLEQAHRAAIVDGLFCPSSNGNHKMRPLVELALAGHGTVGAWARPQRSLGNQVQEKQKPIQCVFLSTPEACDEIIPHYLKRRYPSWEVPPDLQAKSTISSSISTTTCPDVPAVPLPIPLTRETSKELKLLSFAFRGRNISKSVFLPLAKLLTDRDRGLWDNLPWNQWTIDPEHNVPKHYSQTKSGQKYLLGRRDAYNRMIGKDWYGRSLSAGNLASRIKYGMEMSDDDDADKDKDETVHSAVDSNLAFRILKLQLQEATEELAEAERKYSIMKARFEESQFTSDEVLIAHYEEIKASVDQVNQSMQAKKVAEDALEEFHNPSQASETQLEATVNEFLETLVQSRYIRKNKSAKGDDNSEEWRDTAHKFVEGIRNQDLLKDLGTILDREVNNKWKNPFITFLDGVIEKETRNAPPYRGAIGYAPRVDTKEEMFHKAVLPYRSPYDLLVEIIEEQFNAQVVGTVLENSSLFPGTLILEGAVVLRRRGNVKTIKLGGEVVELEDSEDDMGNRGVKMGETIVVECSGAEAIGMSLACNIPLSVERKVWEEIVTDITLSSNVKPLSEGEKESVMNTIPPVKQAPNSSRSVSVTEGGEALVGSQKSEEKDDEENSVDMASIRSVADYDALTIPKKAHMILSSGKFEGVLPRPRALRQFQRELDIFRRRREEYSSSKEEQKAPTIRTTLSPLDEILVPLLEEKSVCLEILQRDAYRRDDQLAIESIQRTIDEFREQSSMEGDEKQNREDGNKPSVSILETLDEVTNSLEKEIKSKILTEENTEDEKSSISEWE